MSLPVFLLEPVNKRIAISVAPKSGCATIRLWLWELGYGKVFDGPSIYGGFLPHVVKGFKNLPNTVLITAAVHRDGVSRLRSAYDHRVRDLNEAPDHGLDHFARHLPEYADLFPIVGHHCKPQSCFLGSDPDVYTDIIPLDRLETLRKVAQGVLGVTTPEFTRTHETVRKTSVSGEAMFWLENWCAHDRALGWDGRRIHHRYDPDGKSGLLNDDRRQGPRTWAGK